MSDLSLIIRDLGNGESIEAREREPGEVLEGEEHLGI